MASADSEGVTAERQKLLLRAAGVLAVVAFSIGAMALMGWIFHLEVLKRIHPALVNMKANTAICLMLASISLLLLRQEPVGNTRRFVAQLFAAVIALTGLLTLGEHLFYWDLGIDQFLFRESGLEAGQSFPGRMGVAACLNFFFLGMALLLRDAKSFGRKWANGFAFAAAIVTFLVFLYYFYGIEYEPIAMYATIALHTVVAFLSLSAGILLARPQHGIVAALMGPNSGSVIARRMLPAAVFVPIVAGWLRVMGQKAGWFGTGFGTAMFAGLLVLVFTGLIWWIAVWLNRSDAQRKAAEESLRRVALFPAQNPAPVLRVTHDALLLYANPAAIEVFKEWNLRAGQFVPTQIRNLVNEALGGKRICEHEQKVGSRDYLVTIAPILEDGYVNLYWRDITERKLAEQTNARLAAIVEFSEDAIISKDINGIITSWNQGAEHLFGYAPHEAIGQPITLLIPPDHLDEESGIMARIRQGEAVEHYETIRRRKDGVLLNLSVTVSPVRDERGQIVGASKIARDITERIAAERALFKAREDLEAANRELENKVAERTAALRETIAQLETFSYSITHDMRGPLRAMGSFAQMLAQDYRDKLDDQGRLFLQRIIDAARRMDRLIQDVLQYSRAARGELPLEIVNVEKLLREVVSQYPDIAEHRERIHFQVQPAATNVRANVAALTQVLSNLLTNAVKFVAPGAKPEVNVLCEKRGDALRVTIEDNGIGIPSEQLGKIFGVFQRLHGPEYSGTGIGLSIVKKAIERMGGTFGVESEPGKGSRFWIELPKATGAERAVRDSRAVARD